MTSPGVPGGTDPRDEGARHAHYDAAGVLRVAQVLDEHRIVSGGGKEDRPDTCCCGWEATTLNIAESDEQHRLHLAALILAAAAPGRGPSPAPADEARAEDVVALHTAASFWPTPLGWEECRDLALALVPVLAALPSPGQQEAERTAVLREVHDERTAQEVKWGQQNHPDGTGPDLIFRDLPAFQNHARADHMVAWAKARCQGAAEDGGDTFERILTEEHFEALAERDPRRLRAELIQVAAVAVAWVEAIDRRAARSAASPDGGDEQ